MLFFLTVFALGQAKKKVKYSDLDKKVQLLIQDYDSVRVSSDSISWYSSGNVLSISSTTLSADNVTVTFNSNNKLGQTIYKDTTTVIAAAPDSVGAVITLKQLSSTNLNGGGDFVYSDSTDLKTVLGTAVPKGGIILAGSGVDRVWVRQAFLDDRRVNVKWFGAKGDGSTNDAVALQLAIDFATDNGFGRIYFPKGDYKYSAELDLNIPVAASGKQYSLTIEGDGTLWTILRPDAGINGLIFRHGGGKRYFHPSIKNLSILGSANPATQDTGIVIWEANNGHFESVNVDSFLFGVYVHNAEALTWNSLSTGYNRFGYFQTANSNGNTILNYSSSFNDSIGVWIRASRGFSLINPDMGNQPINIKADSIGSAIVILGNWERCDSAHVLIGDDSKIILDNMRIDEPTNWLGNIYGNNAWLIIRGGSWQQTAAAKWNVVNPALSGVIGNEFINLTNYRFYDAVAADFKPITPYKVTKRGTNLPAEVTSTDFQRGLFRWLARDDGESLADAMGLETAINDTINYMNIITDGNDLKFGVNDTAGVYKRKDRGRVYAGWFNASTSAGDSTEFSVKTDLSGVTGFLSISPLTMHVTGGSKNVRLYSTLNAASAATGLVTWIIHHPDDTGGSIAIRVYWHIIVQAKEDGTWNNNG